MKNEGGGEYCVRHFSLARVLQLHLLNISFQSFRFSPTFLCHIFDYLSLTFKLLLRPTAKVLDKKVYLS